MRFKQIIAWVVAALMLTGCSLWPFGKNDELEAIRAEVRQINENLPTMEPMVLQVTGYGAINPTTRGVTEVQRRLLAMRASKLDAYRTLAERVYGTQIVGSSTVENLVVQNDQYRAFVDARILGARVVYQDVLADGSYETMVEMIIDQGFRNCLATAGQGRSNTSCAADALHDLNAISREQLSVQGIESNGTGLYFIE